MKSQPAQEIRFCLGLKEHLLYAFRFVIEILDYLASYH